MGARRYAREITRLTALLASVLGGAPGARAADDPGSTAASFEAAAPILCTASPGPVALGSAQWNGWGRGLENARYQPEPAIRASDVPRLALKWAFGYAGASGTAGQPTLVDGRVFAGSAGHVYSLDAKTGCTYWRYDVDSHEVSAVAIAELATPRQVPAPRKGKRGRHINAHLDVIKAPSAALFGDEKGNVFAVNAEHGTLMWRTQVESQPTARIEGAPVAYRDRVYVAVGSDEAPRESGVACCAFRGSIAALDLGTGRMLWKTYLIEEPQPLGSSTSGVQRFGPAGSAVAGTPAVDPIRGMIYVATGDSFNAASQPQADAVVALDLMDGKIRWSEQPQLQAQPSAQQPQPPAQQPRSPADVASIDGAVADGGGSREFLAPPILRSLSSGRPVVVAGQRSGVVYALDPERSGELLWQLKVAGISAEGIEYGMAADYHSVYAAITGVPASASGASGSLVAIDLKTGVRRWQTAAPMVACNASSAAGCSHGQAQAVTVIPGAAFSGSMDGHLRGYSTIDGKILWDYDTAKEFATVNRVAASGGSLDRGGAIIVNGVVYVNSGSDRGIPGNVLLAFSVDGR